MEVKDIHREVKKGMIQHFESHTPCADTALDPVIQLDMASRTVP
jgi:hypothetical protein